MKKRFTEEQIIGFLREAASVLPVTRCVGGTAFLKPATTFGAARLADMGVSDAKCLKELGTENGGLKRMLADALLAKEVAKEALRKQR